MSDTPSHEQTNVPAWEHGPAAHTVADTQTPAVPVAAPEEVVYTAAPPLLLTPPAALPGPLTPVPPVARWRYSVVPAQDYWLIIEETTGQQVSLTPIEGRHQADNLARAFTAQQVPPV